MSTTERPTQAQVAQKSPELANEPDGWLIFAGVTLMVAGVMRFFDALWAFAYKGSVNLQNALFGHDLNTYGWLWLGVAIVLFVCGMGVMVRSQFSRWVGIFAGAFAAISAIWWMPYFPVWSLTYIAVGVMVVYGLAAHGGRRAY